MPKRNALLLFIIIALFAFSVCALIYPMFGREEMRLGLDLVGGVHLVYRAQFSEDTTASDKSDAMDRAVLTIERRIDTYGVTEPIIQRLGEDRILVQLPGFTDIEAAKKLVEQTGFLEFREVELNGSGELVYLSDYLESTSSDFFDTQETGTRIFVSQEQDENYGKPVAFLIKDEQGLEFTDANGNPIDKETLEQYQETPSWIVARGDDGTPLTGDLLADAAFTLSQDVIPEPQVGIEWNDEGSVIFDQIAARLHDPLGNQGPYQLQYVLGIFLDNALISAPKVSSASFQGSGVISDGFTTESAEELANLLKSGALPVQLEKPPLYQEKVSATLGAEFINRSWVAGLIGMALVMAFMIAYYRLSGFMASLALIFYGVLSLAIFKLIPVTLTLAGIGGFIVSIGIAVDANVLIFERMKEELRGGRTLGAAIEAGFHRAWSAIWDSNVTTFIACIILYWLGSTAMVSAAVIGFAVTLFIGAVVSMFTAVTVTRTLLRLFVGGFLANKTWLFSPYVGGKK